MAHLFPQLTVKQFALWIALGALAFVGLRGLRSTEPLMYSWAVAVLAFVAPFLVFAIAFALVASVGVLLTTWRDEPQRPFRPSAPEGPVPRDLEREQT